MSGLEVLAICFVAVAGVVVIIRRGSDIPDDK